MNNKTINDKTSPNQMRTFLKRMRENKGLDSIIPYIKEESNTPKKDLNMRDMLKITRNLNEQTENKINRKTVYDQGTEEEKFRRFFNDMNVDVKFIDLEVYDYLVFWGGTINGIIQFIYKVTPDKQNSGVEFNYLEDFSPDNPENDEIVGRIKSYYDNFYKYWRNNMLQK